MWLSMTQLQHRALGRSAFPWASAGWKRLMMLLLALMKWVRNLMDLMLMGQKLLKKILLRDLMLMGQKLLKNLLQHL